MTRSLGMAAKARRSGQALVSLGRVRQGGKEDHNPIFVPFNQAMGQKRIEDASIIRQELGRRTRPFQI